MNYFDKNGNQIKAGMDIVVTHFSVIHPNLGILQKLADKLKTIGCGIVSLHERVNTLYLDDTIRNTILPKTQNT